MSPPVNDALMALVAVAAALRATGTTWEKIAEEVGRDERTGRRWPREYHRQWMRSFSAAKRRLIGEAGTEALIVLRRLFHSQAEKQRDTTGKFLLHADCDLLPPDEELTGGEDTDNTKHTKYGPTIALLEKLNEAERRELLDQLIARWLAERAHAQAAGDAGASAAVDQ